MNKNIKNKLNEITNKKFPTGKAAKIDFNINNLEFPELTAKNTIRNFIIESNFKNAINQQAEKELVEINNIPYGCIELYTLNGKNITKYSDNYTPNNNIQNIENINSNMFYAIEHIKKNGDNYIQNYDNIHGEGTYAERFIPSPIFFPESDNEDNEDSDYEDAFYLNDDYESDI